MPFRTTLLAILILFSTQRFTHADAPSTEPATDSSSPSEAFKTFVQDIRQGKPADLPALCDAQAPDAQSFLHDMQAIATAVDHLRSAVSKKYGPSFVDTVIPPIPSRDDLSDMTESIDESRATLHASEVGNIPMIKTDGRWKFDLDTMRHGPDYPENPKYFAELAHAITRTADDITAGKIATPESATEALDAQQKAIADEPPATQP